MAQSGVSKSVPPHTKVFGYPAREEKQAKRINACIQSLPSLFKEFREIKERLQKLEQIFKEKHETKNP